MAHYRDRFGTPMAHTIALSLPESVWTVIDTIRSVQQRIVTQPIFDRDGRDTGHLMKYTNPALALGPFVAKIIRDHADDPIVYPDPSWLLAHGEGKAGRGERRAKYAALLGPPMVTRSVEVGPHGHRVIADRAAREGRPIAEVLRRLLRQVLAA